MKIKLTTELLAMTITRRTHSTAKGISVLYRFKKHHLVLYSTVCDSSNHFRAYKIISTLRAYKIIRSSSWKHLHSFPKVYWINIWWFCFLWKLLIWLECAWNQFSFIRKHIKCSNHKRIILFYTEIKSNIIISTYCNWWWWKMKEDVINISIFKEERGRKNGFAMVCIGKRNSKTMAMQFKRNFKLDELVTSDVFNVWFSHTMLINRRMKSGNDFKLKNASLSNGTSTMQWENEWTPINQTDKNEETVTGHSICAFNLFDFRYNLLDQFKLIYWFAHTMHNCASIV